MQEQRTSKVMTTKEAVSRFVRDGDTVVTGNFGDGLPLNLVFEIIRQRKKKLTYYSQTGLFDSDFLVAGGCVDKLCSVFHIKWGGRKGGGVVERYQRAGTLQVEDYTNFTFNARFAAGAYGYSFMPVLPAIMDSDVFKIRGHMGENKFGVVRCPFTKREIPVVPAANPDVCLLHVQRADQYGNAQHWGGLGPTVHNCLASKNIIVSCEGLVDYDVIKSSPHHTIVPGFRVNAVIEEPFGCHPIELAGYRNPDMVMINLISAALSSEELLGPMMDEWIYQLPDRAAYISHYVQLFGQESLYRFKAKSYYSAPANYGVAFESGWDADGKAISLGVDMAGLEKLIDEEGDIVDVK
jgi:glutaconate CoA-transferase subunit A